MGTIKLMNYNQRDRRNYGERLRLQQLTDTVADAGRQFQTVVVDRQIVYKSSAGDRGHNRQGPKRGGLLCPFRGRWDPV